MSNTSGCSRVRGRGALVVGGRGALVVVVGCE